MIYRKLGLLGKMQANSRELGECRACGGGIRSSSFLLKCGNLDCIVFGLARCQEFLLLFLKSFDCQLLGFSCQFLLRCCQCLCGHRGLAFCVLLSLSGTRLRGAPLHMGQQAEGRKISFLVALKRTEKSLLYSRFLDWAGE
jgi:hypothetical protein